MITDIEQLYAAIQSVVSTASGVPIGRVILADQGRPIQGQESELYATYNPIPVRAYGQARKASALVESDADAPSGHKDLAESTITQLDMIVSCNFINEGARASAMRLINANFRQPVRAQLVENAIGWRYVSDIRNLTELAQGGLQPRYQADMHVYIETGITDTILRAAGFSVELTDENGNVL